VHLNKIIALILIILLLPIYFLVSLIILLDDGFPILYNHKKYGKNNKVFTFYKFRTMKNNTPQVPTEEFNIDNNILRSGRFLRKYSIDEIPQFFNVLKGDMNFIGPRPGMVENEERLKKLRDKKKIYLIQPGITGLAQVNGRDINNYEEKVNFDYEYMINANFLLNAKIIFKTFYVVLIPKDIKH